MPRCKGVAGFLFGHKFRARYSAGQSNISEVSGRGITSKDYIHMVEASKPRTYVYDVCERCGQRLHHQAEGE